MSLSRKKVRLDSLIVQKKLADSRTKAQALILAGQVMVDGLSNPKAGIQVPEDTNVQVVKTCPWVGRGGEKLAGALDDFGLAGNLSGTWLDSGSSTGGFVQALLENGAQKVYAVDVGYGLLDQRLREDSRVVTMERTNIRYLAPCTIGERLCGATLDLSFISLRLVLPTVRNLLDKGSPMIALVKPQFEGNRNEVGKGGIVRDDNTREQILKRFRQWARDQGWRIKGQVPCRITGRKGNREEFFLLIS